MLTGNILLTHFQLEAEKLTITNPQGVEIGVYGLTAHLLHDGQKQADITIPLTVDGVISVCGQLAKMLSPGERAELMAALAMDGVLLAKPGDERKVADAMKPGP